MNGDIEHAAAVLRWYRDIGVDEAVAPAPVNRFAAAQPEVTESRTETTPSMAPPREAPTLPPGPAPARAAMPLAEAGGDTDAATAAMKATTHDELMAAIHAFEGCALKRTATTTCIYDGNPEAAIMVIGEAPGRDEDIQGKPFVGAAGKLLDKMLAAIGLDRTNTYITNTLYWRPPGNRTPTPEELAMCLPFLERQVELIAPKLLVYTGGTAAKAMLGRSEGITRLRGRWFSLEREGREPVPAIAMFHPAYLLRRPENKRHSWKDLQAIRDKARELGLADPATRQKS